MIFLRQSKHKASTKLIKQDRFNYTEMGVTYYAISRETVINAGLEALISETPDSLIGKAIEQLKEGRGISGKQDLDECEGVFEVGQLSLRKSGQVFVYTCSKQDQEEFNSGNMYDDYIIFDECDIKPRTILQFRDEIKQYKIRTIQQETALSNLINKKRKQKANQPTD